ncbi:unnamed protein product [Pedinophyceae sp. YPF-701]|nr:unnamed protein product [Pedinophyceae sp. YPF-701]
MFSRAAKALSARPHPPPPTTMTSTGDASTSTGNGAQDASSTASLSNLSLHTPCARQARRYGHPAHPVRPDDVDVVIPTIRHLGQFLELWRPILTPYHLIIVQDGEATEDVGVPDGFHYDLYTRRDIERILGPRASCISYKDSGCRCFGYLMSRRPYIVTLDDDCYPAPAPAGSDSDVVDVVQEHLRNLTTRSTPFYFNTLYDPFADSTDFVRGYPFSLREGVPTVVSHGLWLNVPDYDAPTQLVKPLERNFNHAASVVCTIPHGTLFPMCGMNLAFDRRRIGACMYFGLMGEGQPLSRYDDMWAGWCSKVVCDELGYGAKSGAPYVFHSKASDPFANLKKEFNGLFWQEDMVRFFRDVKLSDKAATPEELYLELADAVEQRLGDVNAYFVALAKGMRDWVACWRMMQDTPVAPRGSKHSAPRA